METETEKKSKNNIGCSKTAICIFVIANLIFYFLTSSKVDIANFGAFFVFVIFLALAIFGIAAFLKLTKDASKYIRVGGSIGIFSLLMFVCSYLIKHFNSMFVIGIFGSIIACSIFGLIVYYSYNK